MKLTIRDIVKLTKWKDVKRAIKFYYPKDKNNYEVLFYRLGTMPKVRTKQGEQLEIYAGPDLEWYGTEYGQKFLKDLQNGLEDSHYSIHLLTDEKYKDGTPKSYSLSFIPWKRLANTPIHARTIKHYTFADIIAHFIWEITYYGSEKQSAATIKKILKSAKSITKLIES